MPRLATAADLFGETTRSFAVAHPSLPNHLAIAGGSTFGVHDDDPPAAPRLVMTAPDRGCGRRRAP